MTNNIHSNVTFGVDRDIDLKVYVYRRPHLRDHNLEFEFHIGMNVLQGLFDEMRMMPEITEVSLSFPENWLNIIEQRALFQRLGHYCPNLKKVQIKTHSVYIIQCVPNTSCFVVSSDYENEHGLSQELDKDGKINLTDKLYSPMVGNFFNALTLNVLHGAK